MIEGSEGCGIEVWSCSVGVRKAGGVGVRDREDGRM